MLESGEYYKDANGDKVGPMEPWGSEGRWSNRKDYVGGFWLHSGHSLSQAYPDLVSIADETKPMSEWNPQPGDVFGWVTGDYEFKQVIPLGETFEGEYQCCIAIFDKEKVSLISRASPTKFCDLTDAEKGALLLAWHNGEYIEGFICGSWHEALAILDRLPYRIKPRPVVVQFNDTIEVHGENHPAYYSTIDGKVDWSTFTLIKE